MRPIVKIAGGFGALVLVVVLAAAVVLSTMDFNRYKGLVVDAVFTATGRKLVIAGDVDLALGFTPALVVEGISLANAAWGSRPEMLTVGRAEVKVALLPLFSRRLVVRRLVLLEPDILLETSAAGVGNWVFPRPKESSSEVPEVHHVVIRKGLFRYRDGESGRTTLFALENLAASAAGLESPVTVKLAGTWNGAPATAKATLGSLQALTAGESFPLSLVASAGGAAITVDGTIAGSAGKSTGKGLDLAVGLEGADLAGLAGLADVRLHRTGPYRLQGRLTGQGKGYLFDNIVAKLGKSDLSGSLAVRSVAKHLEIEADLGSGLFDFHDFLPGGPKQQGAAPAGPGASGKKRVFSDEPLFPAALPEMDAKVKFRAQRLVTSSMLLEKAGLDLELAKGKLTVRPFTARVGGGDLSADLFLDRSRSLPQLRFNLKTRGVEAGRVLAGLGKGEIMSGVPMAITLELAGSGHSLRALMAGLDGRVLLQAGPGRINSRYLDFAGADVLSQLLAALYPTTVRKDHTALECAVFNFAVRDGIATTSKGIALRTSLMTVVGSGGINLKTEELDIGIKPAARSGIGVNLGQLAGAVRLGGTLARPGVRVDPAGAVKTAATIGGAIATGGVSLLAGALFERATADEDPCRTALGLKPARQDAARPATDRDRQEGGIGGVIKGLFGR